MLVLLILPAQAAESRYAGLTGAPDESGKKRRERGLAKAGNARVRRGMIELAWGHLVHQKASALTAWYRKRTSDARGGTRKTMIVALARKLLSCAVAARDNRRDAGRSAAAPGRLRTTELLQPSALSMPSCS